MSDMSMAAAFIDAARVPVWTRPSAGAFTPKGGDPSRFSAWAEAEGDADPGFHVAPSNDVADAEALIAQGYADGLSEGRGLAMIELEEERSAFARLAESLESLKPQNSDGLAALLAATVKRLVAQVVGETEIDAATLAERAQAVAAMIAEETSPKRLRLHPTDLARLGEANIAVEMVADPMLAPGTIMLDTGAGWVEDGPNVRLEKLRNALDRMGAPR